MRIAEEMDARTEALEKYLAEVDRIMRSNYGVKGDPGGEAHHAKFMRGRKESAELLLDLTAGRDISPDELTERANRFQDQGKMLEQQALREAATYLKLGAAYRDLLDATRKELATAAV